MNPRSLLPGSAFMPWIVFKPSVTTNALEKMWIFKGGEMVYFLALLSMGRVFTNYASTYSSISGGDSYLINKNMLLISNNYRN